MPGIELLLPVRGDDGLPSLLDQGDRAEHGSEALRHQEIIMEFGADELAFRDDHGIGQYGADRRRGRALPQRIYAVIVAAVTFVVSGVALRCEAPGFARDLALSRQHRGM